MEWLTEGLMVTVLGICTVFVVLIFISLILTAFGKLNIDSGKKKAEEKAAVKPAPAVVPVTDKKVNDDLELIAVITAAIAAQECAKGNNIGPDKLVVRSLRRVNTWNREAIHEQQNNLF